MTLDSAPSASPRPPRREVLEGRLCILAALEARLRTFEAVLVGEKAKPEKIDEVLAAAKRAGVAVRKVAADELDAAAHGKSHGGLVAIVGPRPTMSPGDFLSLVDALAPAASTVRAHAVRPYDVHGGPAFLLLLDGIEDDRNLGYTLRSAEALGVHAVLVRRHAWDFDATEVSRASSGAFERIPLVRIDRESDLLPRLRERGIRICGGVPRAQKTLWEAYLGGPVCLAVGGEKRGLSAAVRSRCDRFITIPMKAGATSLSLSHAASILMAEVVRQRGQKAEGSR